MNYTCVHCEHTFAHEGETKPRCPKCMRIHGIAPSEGDQGGKAIDGGAGGTAPEAGAMTPPLKWGLLAAAVLAVAGGAWWATSGSSETAGPSSNELSDMAEAAGVKLQSGWGATDLFAAKANVRELASKVDGSGVSAAESLRDLVQARRKAGAFVSWAMTSPREVPARQAEEAAEALLGEQRLRLYPLEVASVGVAALRAKGVSAFLVEVLSFPGSRTPPEPTGNLGYFAVGVGDTPENLTVVDVYEGRQTAPEEGAFRGLSDLQAVGHWLNHRALHALASAGEPQKAFALSEAATELDGRSPAIRAGYGSVLLASGGDGIAEIQAALALSDDAPRHQLMAGLALAQGDMSGASRHVAKALELSPDYADALALSATLSLARRDLSSAKATLDKVRKLSPDLPILALIDAQIAMSEGRAQEAAELVLRAAQAEPRNWSVRIQAGQVLRAAGRYDDMRRMAREALDLAPSSMRAQLQQQIQMILGPTALEAPDDEDATGRTSSGAATVKGLMNQDLKLGEGSRLLGDDDSTPGSVSGDSSEQGGPLMQLGDPDNFSLGGDSLRLNLGE